ncbi:MAG: urea transporter, partial [Chloroflexi bacterium]|nr:urea transporter [Chloroflexota bacterium]
MAPWARLLRRTPAWDFADTLLRGWAAGVFWDRPAVGLAVLLLVFLDPWAGATSLMASAAATAVAMALKIHPSLLKTGLYGLNGALVGLVATWYVPAHPFLLPVVAVAAALSVPLTSLWIGKVSIKTQLPVLTVPFLLVSWALFAALRPLEPALSSSLYYQLGWTSRLEGYIWDALPGDIILFLRSLSWLFFEDSAILGAAAFGLLVLRSRVAGLFALMGYLVGLTSARSLVPGIHAQAPLLEMVVAFNAAFIAVCLGGFFLRFTWTAAPYALLGAGVGSVVAVGLAPFAAAARLPLLNAPFLLVTLLFLALARSRPLNLRKADIEALPLDRVSTPESTLDLPWSRKGSGQLRLTLPFYGVWYVAQGTHGLLTHRGFGSHAWDFIVVDSQGRSCRGVGRQADDYYAFGLPVVAPAPGVVVSVRDHVQDNIPPEVNKKENWGNYVIIDHGGGLYSELSHFRRQGIVVKEGDTVSSGQLLGYLGNSGLSMEPHLHYQLQRGPATGARTVLAKF